MTRDDAHPRLLFVAPILPWPVTGGTDHRLAAMMEALSAKFCVELVVLRAPGYPEKPLEQALSHVETVRFIDLPAPRWTFWQAGAWFVRPTAPWAVHVSDAFAVVAEAGIRWSDYQLIWCAKGSTAIVVPPAVRDRLVVDLDDLEDDKLRRKLQSTRAETLRARIMRVRDRRDLAPWTRLQKRLSDESAAVVVCSDADAERLATSNARVVPNGYPRPTSPAGTVETGRPPVLLFAGNMEYGPNEDAARWLLADVAPAIWRRLPQTRILLVGQCRSDLPALASDDRVTVAGFVDDITEALSQADAVVVPIRWGSGTRLKILEAFAHRIPVVSTKLGAEGLAVVPERDLLIEETADGLADACYRVLTDPDLRRRLVEQAVQTYDRNYESARTGEATVAVAQDVVLHA